MSAMANEHRRGPVFIEDRLDPPEQGYLFHILRAGAQDYGYREGGWTPGRIRSMFAKEFRISVSKAAAEAMLKRFNEREKNQ